MANRFFPPPSLGPPAIDETVSIPGSSPKITTVSENLVIEPTTGKNTRIGSSFTTTRTFTSNDDFGCNGTFVANGPSWLESNARVGGLLTAAAGLLVQGGNTTFTSTTSIQTGYSTFWGTGNLGGVQYNTAQTNDALLWMMPLASRTMIFCERGDQGTDFGGAVEADPTLRLQASDATPANHLRLTWDEITTGGSNLKLGPASGNYLVFASIKTDAGDPGTPVEGMFVINTNDNNIKVYADAAWRTLVSW